MAVIDIHSHILPGIDDGSRDLETTRKLMEEGARQGVEVFCATPHFYQAQNSISKFLERRDEAYKKTLDMYDKQPLNGKMPNMKVAAEVYYFMGVGETNDIEKLCYTDTRVLLLEMPFAQWDKHVVRDVEKLIERQELKLIIAHIERYYKFQKDKSFWNEVFSMPVYPQLNGEIFEKFMDRLFAFKHIKADEEILLGSDCHNLKNRKPNLEMARGAIEKKFGRKTLEEIDSRGSKLLGIDQ
ncbi:MAG TPA: hypothetical protein DCQ46_00450 [Lachnospiraceae bacterium]|nr:hypothetical protein [Lachnospiraceae bacterium]